MQAEFIVRNWAPHVGVNWSNNHRAWIARIKRHGKDHFLGHFKIEREAERARKEAEIEYDGRYGNKLTRSAFDDFTDAMYPTPAVLPKPASGMLPELPSALTPSTSLTTDELFAFINRNMLVRGNHIFWKRDGGVHLVPHEWGHDLEILLTFKTQGGERHVVGHPDVAWMLTHQRPIPEGHTVKHSDGKVTNQDPHNLWLVKVTD